MSDGTKPFPDPVLTYHEWGSFAFTSKQYRKARSRIISVTWVRKWHFWIHYHISLGMSWYVDHTKLDFCQSSQLAYTLQTVHFMLCLYNDLCQSCSCNSWLSLLRSSETHPTPIKFQTLMCYYMNPIRFFMQSQLDKALWKRISISQDIFP